MSIQILGQICRPKLNPQTKADMNLLNNNQRTTIFKRKCHQRSIYTFGKFCIRKLTLHTKFYFNWLITNQRLPKGHQMLIYISKEI